MITVSAAAFAVPPVLIAAAAASPTFLPSRMALDEKNTTMAVDFLRAACYTGLARAQFLYARLLDSGCVEGVPKDEAAAVELLRYAMMQDDKDARRMLEEKQDAKRAAKKLQRSKSGPGRGGGVALDGEARAESPQRGVEHSLEKLRGAVSERAVGSSAGADGVSGKGSTAGAAHRNSVTGLVVPTVVLASASTPTNTSLHGLDTSPPSNAMTSQDGADSLSRRRSRGGSAFKPGGSVKKRSQSSHDSATAFPGVAVDVVSASSSSTPRVMKAVLDAGDVTDGNESELGGFR